MHFAQLLATRIYFTAKTMSNKKRATLFLFAVGHQVSGPYFCKVNQKTFLKVLSDENQGGQKWFQSLALSLLFSR
jgi:hypothetical protein